VKLRLAACSIRKSPMRWRKRAVLDWRSRYSTAWLTLDPAVFDHFLTRKKLQRVLNYLETERKLIMTGDYDGIGSMIETREAQIADIENLSDDIRASLAPMLVEIRTKSERNRGLLKQALAGLSKSRSFLREIADARQKLRTYNREGSSYEVVAEQPAKSRKA